MINNTKILKNNEKFEIYAIYKSPIIKDSDFINNLEEYLNDKKNNECHQILIGDININILEDTKASLEYVNTLAALGFIPRITKPTRTTGKSTSCIDHCFIKTNKSIDNISSGIIDTKITDHDPIIIKVTTENKTNLKQKILNKRINYKKFRTLLETEAWTDFYETHDSDDSAELLEIKLRNALNKSEYTKKSTAKNKKPWITSGIIKSIKNRDNLKKKQTEHLKMMISRNIQNIEIY